MRLTTPQIRFKKIPVESMCKSDATEINWGFRFYTIDEMNTTKIMRAPKDGTHPFTRISNSIGNLKADEIGIMFHLLSNSDDWIINKEDIRKKSKLGERRFDTAWNHLKKLRYIIIEKLPGEHGKFCYRYIINEEPTPQNVGVEPEVHSGGTDNFTRPTLPGYGNPGLENRGTNNNYINKNQKTTASSGSDGLSTKVEVRPGNNNIGPNILDHENKINEELQIVPHPSLCCGEVRDNDEGQIQGPNMISPIDVPNNTTPIVPINSRSGKPEDHQGPISVEVCYSGREKICPQTQEILDNLENVSDDVLINMIDGYYIKQCPNWEYLLRKKQIQGFVKETSKFVVPDTLATELLTQYNIRLKKEAYKKH